MAILWEGKQMTTNELKQLNPNTKIKFIPSGTMFGRPNPTKPTVSSFSLCELSESKIGKLFSASSCWIENGSETIPLSTSNIMQISMKYFTEEERTGAYREFHLENGRIVSNLLEHTFTDNLKNTVVINRDGTILYNSFKNSGFTLDRGFTVVKVPQRVILYHSSTDTVMFLKTSRFTKKHFESILNVLNESADILHFLGKQGKLTVLSHQNGADIIEQITPDDFLKNCFSYRMNPTLILDQEGYPCWTSGSPGLYSFSGATRLWDSHRPKVYCSARTATYYEFKKNSLRPVGVKGTLQEAKDLCYCQ